MQFLIDSNVAIRCVVDSDKLHQLCYGALERMTLQGYKGVLAAQVIAESWSVLTRPLESRGGYGMTPAKADENIDAIIDLGRLLRDPPNLWPTHRSMLLDHSVSGVNVHDCRLAAWCKLHEIDSILTLNPDDFIRFGLHAIHPETV